MVLLSEKRPDIINATQDINMILNREQWREILKCKGHDVISQKIQPEKYIKYKVYDYIYFSWIEWNNVASDVEISPTNIWVMDSFNFVHLIPPFEITINCNFSSSFKLNPLK